MSEHDSALALAIAGATGRMGRQLLALVSQEPALSLAAAWVGPASAALGSTAAASAAGEVRYTALGDASRRPAVVVDFTQADAFDEVLAWCRAHAVALVTGTTGLTADQRASMRAAAAQIPVLWAANFSLGVAVLARMAAEAARMLPAWPVAVTDIHHAGKRDAPSGTALHLAAAMADARGAGAAAPALAALRTGDVVGEHTVLLSGPGERLELVHRAGDRSIFARGALHAARWLAARPPGLYRFEDTLD